MRPMASVLPAEPSLRPLPRTASPNVRRTSRGAGWSAFRRPPALVRAAATAGLVLTLPVPVLAETLDCRFDPPCYSFGGCRDAPLAMRLTWDGDAARIDTPGPRPFEARHHYDEALDVRQITSLGVGGASHMVTIFGNGRAAFSSHTSLETDLKPVWISSIGQCEDQP